MAADTKRGAERAHCGEHAGWRSDCDRCATVTDTKRGAVDRGWAQFERRLISMRSWEWIRIPMFMVREELARHGLHVITAAEKVVLDACGAMTLVQERNTRPPYNVTWVCRGGGQRIVDAEVARREAEKEKTK